jgi:hypothetical protein
MAGEYHVIIASDSNHEMVFAELHCGEKFIASISQERDSDQLQVELPGPGLVEEYVLRKVPLKDFVRLLEMGAQKLLGDA